MSIFSKIFGREQNRRAAPPLPLPRINYQPERFEAAPAGNDLGKIIDRICLPRGWAYEILKDGFTIHVYRRKDGGNVGYYGGLTLAEAVSKLSAEVAGEKI